MQPLVSIIIPVYNAERFVRQALQSALGQTYGNIEVIVVNDGSTDRSPEIISEFRDSRMRIIHQRNRGGSAARNAGIDLAKGEYIKFLDADDELMPEAIEKQVEFSKNLGENEIVFGDYFFLDDDNNYIGHYHFTKEEKLISNPVIFFLSEWEILISCPLHRKEILEKLKGFDERLPFGQENELHIRLALNDVNFKYEKDKIFKYRTHHSPDRISINRINRNSDHSWVDIYRLQKFLDSIIEKYGHLPNSLRDFLVENWFRMAISYYERNDKITARYFLDHSIRYAKYNIPLYRAKRIYGLIFIFLGKIIGFSYSVKIIKSIQPRISKSENEYFELILKEKQQ
jgi:glycosyltransferase involved in cell wall biosynthesis